MDCANQPPASSPSPPVFRRVFLHWLWTIPLAVAALQLLGMAERFSLPKKKAGTFGTVIDAGPLAELPDPAGMPVHHSRGRFWLVNSPEGLVALAHTCTHLECLFDWDREAGCFVCPCHGSQFDRAGRVIAGPAPRALDRFSLHIVAADGTTLSQTDAAGNPLPLPPVPPAPPGEAPAEGGQPRPRLLVDTSRKISAPVQSNVS